MDWDKKIRGYALKNAIAYNGKAQPGSVVSALFHEGLKKEDMKTYGKKISEIVKEINKLSLEEQKKGNHKNKARRLDGKRILKKSSSSKSQGSHFQSF